jgi:hypothetical protein
MRTQNKAARKPTMAKPVSNDGAPDGPSGRFWTQWIQPKGAALLSEMLGPVYFVVKNHGANNVMLMANQGDLMDLSGRSACDVCSWDNQGREQG